VDLLRAVATLGQLEGRLPERYGIEFSQDGRLPFAPGNGADLRGKEVQK
jgi:hypothetical protein